ncbi:rhodanese-like domain-containing protein [Stigmatella hybrida]|uniref:rhodanese-like domain-containing protein n=1 Tax=Stigmatella hybrida TaxID=394097 RepID=UPI001CDAF408|nr:rhodanese-like domain-containing protein [Stigmatella hybrida]
MEPHIPCAELFLRLGDEDVLILDCRSPVHWGRLEVHIPGALRMTPSEVAQHLTMLPDDELIVVCGCDLDEEAAARVCRLLLLRGRNAVCLQGGIETWMAEGFPVESHLADTASALQR